MASYKVAQDVEAEDKLLGPFTFRQLIYLGIVAMCGAVAYGLWRLIPLLALLPAPIMVFFALLALPLRKDQPMETYLAAIISFYLKPRRRLWVPDGIESLVNITAPRVSEDPRTKAFSDMEAERRLAYLATIVDTKGWAIRGVQTQGSSLSDDAYNEAQQIEDPLDTSSGIGQSIDRLIDNSDNQRRQAVINRMHNPMPQHPVVAVQPPAYLQPATIQQAYTPQPQPQPPILQPTPPLQQYQPQSSVYSPTMQPQPSTPVQPQPPTSQIANDNTGTPEPSADIMELANNKDLSIETIAHEAHRRHHKKADDGEVLISLR